ncbi:hypothetical protein BGZ97_009616, partial [Linnemannia gamsii]
MTIQDTLLNVQAVRHVYNNEHSANSSTALTETLYLVCHRDPSSGKDIILWDDIKAAFDDFVIHVRSGAVVLPFLKDADFKNLDPLRIAAIPSVTLDVVVRGQLRAKEMSLESLQGALPDMPPHGSNSNSTLVSDATTRAAITVRRNQVGGLVEEAMQSYNHIDNPATLPPRQGPQAISDDQAAAPKNNDTDILTSPVRIFSSNSSNSDLLLGIPQEYSSSSSPYFAETMMKARLGDKEAQYAVGNGYYFGRGVHRDYQAAMD